LSHLKNGFLAVIYAVCGYGEARAVGWYVISTHTFFGAFPPLASELVLLARQEIYDTSVFYLIWNKYLPTRISYTTVAI
jgi:hypothetical protein